MVIGKGDVHLGVAADVSLCHALRMAKTVVRLAEHLPSELLKAFRPRGYYVMDSRECATRRVDLDQPLDDDPGPLEMPPAEEESSDAIALRFGSD